MPADPFRPTVDAALALIPDGSAVGLGTGRAATAFIRGLGEKVAAGLKVRGIPTSDASAALAKELHIPLIGFDDVDGLDVCVDGADEVDPHGRLIKGYGGALVREKIVAAFARRFVVLVDEPKLVAGVGAKGKLPIEVIPFAVSPVSRTLRQMGLPGEVRQKDGKPFVTDNGNLILDAKVPVLPDPAGLERQLLEVPGVLGTGLFLNMADVVIVQTATTADVRHYKR